VSGRFDICATPIAGLHVLQRKPIGDRRGYLERLFCADDLQALVPNRQILQVNHTLTATRGTVRGLHFQHPPHAETKFVHCLRGEVFDVAVDLRRGSPTFLQWHAELLGADNHKTFVIPEGFAHGFQTLSDDCEMLYFHTATYHPDAEGGLNAQDPRFAVSWPLPVSGLSPRDAAHPMLDEKFMGVDI
jgi:dTDP-4-dehydrorhamnose 3,5-epimerase